MSDQRFPDGEFAKQVTLIAERILTREKKLDNNSTLTREEYLKTIVQVSDAFRGILP